MADALIVYAVAILAETAVPHLDVVIAMGGTTLAFVGRLKRINLLKIDNSSHSNNSQERVSHGNPQKPRGLNPESEPFHLPEEPTAALYMGAREGIFLQTAGALAFNVDLAQ